MNLISAVLLSVSMLMVPAQAGGTNVEIDEINCPLGYVCLTNEEVVEINEKMLKMEGKILKLKTSRGLTGWCAGPGGGVQFDFDENEFQPSVGAYIIWGLRW